MKLTDKQAIKKWQDFSRSFSKGRNIDLKETESQKQERIAYLLSDFPAFCKYYFPKVCKSEFAKWHKKYYKYVIENDRCYAAIKISRDMAKSSVSAMLVMFLYYNKEFKSLGMGSRTEDQAEMLLNPIKMAFQRNEALIHDFGSKKGIRWSGTRFITSDDVSFRAVGVGQEPRGEKSEDADRFDFWIFDDIDHPEVCDNPERLDKAWKWVTGSAIPAMHVSGKRRVVFLNNKIDEDCIIQRAYDHAKLVPNSFRITVNLDDSEGHSNWPEAYTDEECREMIIMAGDEAETEYRNNPVKRGKTFQKEWFQFKKLPPLSRYKYLVAYLDGGFKKTKTSDTKALVLIGLWQGEIHIRKVYVDNVSIETMVAWHYDLFDYLKKKNATAVWWMEEVFLLSLLHDHFDAATNKYGFRIPMLGDKRPKPDKDLRINNTAGFFERGNVWFDESIQDDRYTKRLINQYLRFRVGLRNIEKDGPDAVEGGIHKLREMAVNNIDAMRSGKNPRNRHRI